MSGLAIFGVQFTLSLIVFTLIARWYVRPRLVTLPLREALIPLLFLHAFRHVGLVFLLPTVVGSTLPAPFAVPTAYGDLLTGLLALLAIVALRFRWGAAIALAWLANLVGTLDLLYGFAQGVRFRVALGAAYYIPTVVNPAMYVSHFMIFAMLVTRERRGGEARGRRHAGFLAR
jgi:hypothetical protein